MAGSELMTSPLADRIALVAGGTRGAGRGIAVALGEAGATVIVTGRSTRATRSPMDRPETIEETTDMVSAAGGVGVAIEVDHAGPDRVAALAARLSHEFGRLDLLVNDIWGGDHLTEWVPFWKHDLSNGLALLRQATDTHLITAWHMAELLLESECGLLIGVTDGIIDRYRGSLFYDLAKASVLRMTSGMAHDLRPHRVAAIAVSPGFLRSEAVLEHFGVSEENWRDGIARDPNFAASETPRYIGRGVASLAADPDVFARTGSATASWTLAREYGFTDVDGSRPDWAAHARKHFGWEID
jgi:NAD(P)-dependent dehydrogenase (short-subunit alcohol dehydrogenase family)